MSYEVYHADCFDWLRERQPGSVHAVLADPPYGLVEFSRHELAKLRTGKGGVWRLPPSISGVQGHRMCRRRRRINRDAPERCASFLSASYGPEYCCVETG
ncbi:MAG: hypothetical protein ACKN9T_15960 [Candidatus Methylumidiphilus sp.]